MVISEADGKINSLWVFTGVDNWVKLLGMKWLVLRFLLLLMSSGRVRIIHMLGLLPGKILSGFVKDKMWHSLLHLHLFKGNQLFMAIIHNV